MPTDLVLVFLQHEINSYRKRREFKVNDLFLPSKWNRLNKTQKAHFGIWFNTQVTNRSIINCRVKTTSSKPTRTIYERI